ncbi:hypothetical protein, partial [Martelella mediterranea]|uniref:hypothetical protein n=1 Tax=Martelella mediterranea TaxID=293089 RepID=UPI001A9F44BA
QQSCESLSKSQTHSSATTENGRKILLDKDGYSNLLNISIGPKIDSDFRADAVAEELLVSTQRALKARCHP